MAANDKLALNATEVASLLGISRPTVYALFRREDFPVAKIGKRRLVPKAQLERWLEDQVVGNWHEWQ